jgi:hypothetical protein
MFLNLNPSQDYFERNIKRLKKYFSLTLDRFHDYLIIITVILIKPAGNCSALVEKGVNLRGLWVLCLPQHPQIYLSSWRG